MRYFWKKYLVIPFAWIRYYFSFSYRARFERIFPMSDMFEWKYLPLLIRLVVPLFLISLPIALLLRLGIHMIPSVAASTAIDGMFFAKVVIGTLLGVISGIAFGTIIGKAGVIPMGLVGGLTMDIPFGAGGALSGFAAYNWLALLVVVLSCGVAGGILTIPFKMGVKIGIQVGVDIGIATFVALAAASTTTLFTVGLISQVDSVKIFLVAFSDIILGLMLGFAADRHRESIVRLGILLICLRIGVLFIDGGITNPWNLAFRSGVLFLFSYLISCYQVLPYIGAVVSIFRAYWRSRKNPIDVFAYLDDSVLHQKDFEAPRFRGPFWPLQELLLIAAEQNAVKTIEEIEAILEKYPAQEKAVWATAKEIITHDLEQRNTIDTIEKASGYLTRLLGFEPSLLDSNWVSIFKQFNDACRDAATYLSAKTKEDGSLALNAMDRKLLDIPLQSVADDEGYVDRIEEIISSWRKIIQKQKEVLAQSPSKFGVLTDPFKMGSPIASKDQPFIGRDALLQRLKDHLQPGSSIFLTGERRIGKTSMLLHLPEYMKKHANYLTIVCNLQNTATLSTIAAFFSTLAEGIYKELHPRHRQLRKLDFWEMETIKNAQNEKAFYTLFDNWLKEVEVILRHDNRKLLLAFDEFENLKEEKRTRGANSINVNYLLNWLRAIVTDHPRIVLLFCGLRTPDELGPDWTGRFVQVLKIKVSPLDVATARELVLRPTDNYPGQEIFNAEIVEEILRLTGGHPFLIRALCSELITHLNAHEQSQATLEDLPLAITAVLSSWHYYFSDLLLTRSNEDEQKCLRIINESGKASFTTIAKQIGRNDELVKRTLGKLKERDLLRQEDGFYILAIPLVGKWIEQNL